MTSRRRWPTRYLGRVNPLLSRDDIGGWNMRVFQQSAMRARSEPQGRRLSGRRASSARLSQAWPTKRSASAHAFALVRAEFGVAYRTRRVFRNWPEVLGRLALSRFGYGGGVFTVETRSGLRLQAPAKPSARDALIEVLSEDAYHLASIDWASADIEFVLDVGAHVGSFACALAQRAGQAHFVCVEPFRSQPTGWRAMSRRTICRSGSP